MTPKSPCSAVLLAAILGTCCVAAGGTPRQARDPEAKLAILVDKVMQPEAGWVTEEWMVEEAAAAGFNVLSPRRGHEHFDEVKQVAAWCRKYDIRYLPWMRGTLRASGRDSEGKRLVWASGNETLLWSPNSDELWEWMERHVLEYARISRHNPHLMGVFLDFENYAPGQKGMLYPLSYDDGVLRRFAEAQGVELPVLAPGERLRWLESRGLHRAFEGFQRAHWRERARALRRAVDEVNPDFRFAVYPAPGSTPFDVEIHQAWATQAAPILLADAHSYGRKPSNLGHAEALADNRRKLLLNQQAARREGMPMSYIGGIDPVSPGADPEFSGKNAVMISEVTDGYWVFYEGPKYGAPSHADYWRWFTWANRAIARGESARQHEPRQSPETGNLLVFDRLDPLPALASPAAVSESVVFPASRLRGGNVLVFAGVGGSRVEIELRNHPVKKYPSVLQWDLRDSDGAKIDSGAIPYGSTGKISFTPGSDAVYLLGLTAGRGWYSLVSANVPIGFHAGHKLSLLGGVERLYFHVPSGVDRFRIDAAGWGARETARVNVYGPSGQRMATGQTTSRQEKIRLQVGTGDQRGKTWSLEITQADQGRLEDNWIKLDPGLSPILSPVREHVFALAPVPEAAGK